MSRKRKQLLTATLTLCLLLAAGWGLSKLFPVPPLLTHHATLVIPMHPQTMYYQWRSSDVLLTYALSHPLQTPTQIDVRKGRRTVLNKFDHHPTNYLHTEVSPDGESILQGGWATLDFQVTFTSLTTYVSSQRVWKAEDRWIEASNVVWMPDSRHCLQLMSHEGRLYAVVAGVDVSSLLHKVPIDHTIGTSNACVVIRPRLLGFTQNGRIIATPEVSIGALSQRLYRRINFCEISMGKLFGKPAGIHDYLAKRRKGL